MWSFVLVPSYKWKDLVDAFCGSTGSPAFTIFEQRTTVMESSLFSATATRSAEFLHVFGVTGEALLKLAVNHELGHAFATIKTSGRQTIMVANCARARLRIVAEHQRGKLTMSWRRIISRFRSGFVHHTHPATAQLLDDAVVRDGLANHRVEILGLGIGPVNERWGLATAAAA